jgi:hypothetical protein
MRSGRAKGGDDFVLPRLISLIRKPTYWACASTYGLAIPRFLYAPSAMAGLFCAMVGIFSSLEGKRGRLN